jgi:hypothetical protein
MLNSAAKMLVLSIKQKFRCVRQLKEFSFGLGGVVVSWINARFAVARPLWTPSCMAAGLLTEHSTLLWSETKHSGNPFLVQPSCLDFFLGFFVFFSSSSYNNCVLRLNCRGFRQRNVNKQITGAWCESSHDKSWNVFSICFVSYLKRGG